MFDAEINPGSNPSSRLSKIKKKIVKKLVTEEALFTAAIGETSCWFNLPNLIVIFLSNSFLNRTVCTPEMAFTTVDFP